MRTASSLAILTLCIALIWTAPTSPAAPPQGQGSRGAQVPDDNSGFEPLFDGKSLAGWEGEPGYWHVEDGTIVGETTAAKPLKQNTFLLWRGGGVRDFELKAEFRLTPSANSGIQYRSAVVPEVSRWALKGYQADLDGANAYTGMLYEERARGFLAPRGQFSRMAANKTLKLIADLGDPGALKAFINTGAEWNRIHIIARGNSLMHIVNGRVMAAFIDEDPQARALDGLLGLQLHAGPPMKNEFRYILYKKL